MSYHRQTSEKLTHFVSGMSLTHIKWTKSKDHLMECYKQYTCHLKAAELSVLQAKGIKRGDAEPLGLGTVMTGFCDLSATEAASLSSETSWRADPGSVAQRFPRQSADIYKFISARTASHPVKPCRAPASNCGSGRDGRPCLSGTRGVRNGCDRQRRRGN